MARSIRNKTNVLPPDSDYVFGRVKDNPGDNSGTPVDEKLVGDWSQFFEKLMFDSGLAFNELPDNAYSGFQFNQALSILTGGGNFTDFNLQNGWTNSGGYNAGYRVVNGKVELRGIIVAPAGTGLDITLAIPQITPLIGISVQIPIVDTSPAIVALTISSLGVLTIASYVGTHTFNLEGINYRHS